MITIDLVERLRYEGESDSLDFKSAQYAFAGATEEEKSELLKDILAFANSWRRTDAYILIGFREVKGGQAEVVGISQSLDDAHLQQFINGKLQRPLRFAYTALKVEGSDVAVIHIPQQERPFYAIGKYGKVEANTIYVRRGSSTAIAKPDEVARMGRAEAGGVPDIQLDVFFAHPKTRQRLTPSLQSHVIDIPPLHTLPDYTSSSRGRFDLSISRYDRSDYYRELARFTRANRLLAPVWLGITNTGSTAALDVRLEALLPGEKSGVWVLDSDQYPDVPNKQFDIASVGVSRAVNAPAADLQVANLGDHWLISGRADKVQPKSTEWFFDAVYVGAEFNGHLDWEIKVFADNLQAPHEQRLQCEVTFERETADLQRIIELEAERFGNSAEHRRFLERHGLDG